MEVVQYTDNRPSLAPRFHDRTLFKIALHRRDDKLWWFIQQIPLRHEILERCHCRVRLHQNALCGRKSLRTSAINITLLLFLKFYCPLTDQIAGPDMTWNRRTYLRLELLNITGLHISLKTPTCYMDWFNWSDYTSASMHNQYEITFPCVYVTELILHYCFNCLPFIRK